MLHTFFSFFRYYNLLAIDSPDDRFSIRMGVRHANQHGYKSMYYRVIVEPLKFKGFGY
jgi:hypothetical protein